MKIRISSLQKWVLKQCMTCWQRIDLDQLSHMICVMLQLLKLLNSVKLMP